MAVIGNVLVLCACFFNVIIFSMNGSYRKCLGVWVKTLEFAGMPFIYLKVTSKKSAPETSVYSY